MGIFDLNFKRVILLIIAVIFLVAAVLVSYRFVIAMQSNHDDAVYQHCVEELVSKGQCFEIAYKH